MQARRVLPALRLFAAVLLCAAAAWSQPASGAIKGVLADSSGAVVPAVTVTLNGNGGTRSAQSQADGSYTFSGLQPGPYTISVALEGFDTFSHVVTVNAGATAQMPIQLAVKAEKQ